MSTNTIRIGACLASVLFSTSAFAVYNGTYESDLPVNQQHRYAGLMYYYSKPNNFYYTCGASLVDSPLIPTAYKRKIVITAAHCVGNAEPNQAISVTFVNQPGMILDNGTRFPTGFTGIKASDAYAGKAFVNPSSGNAAVKDDIAVIVLNKAVSEKVVPSMVQLPAIGFVDNIISGDILRMTGYGTIVWGNSNSTGIDDASSTGANSINGPREKMTITMNVLSVQPTQITEQMNFQQGDATACNGDSGSGWILETGPEPVIVGTTLAGDFNCRAINTTARLDTQSFYNLLNRAMK